MRRQRIKRLIVFSLPFLVAGVVSYTLATLTFGGSSTAIATTGGPPPPEKMAAFRALRDAQKQLDDSKPRFLGRLGDFEVVGTSAEAHPSLFCSGARGTIRDFVASELNKPGMKEQVLCGDGTVAATYSATGRRSYFKGAPKISAQAPLDRLKLQQFEGRSALLVEPPITNGPYFLYVIERAPSASAPGILVAVHGMRGLQDTFDLARQALSK